MKKKISSPSSVFIVVSSVILYVSYKCKFNISITHVYNFWEAMFCRISFASLFFFGDIFFNHSGFEFCGFHFLATVILFVL